MTVQTTGAHVSDVLSAEGYAVHSHDLLAPAADTTIHNGQTIVFKRGRQLHLTINGEKTNVWTTEPTVSQALSVLGIAPADFVSVSRSKRLPLSPTAIVLRTPKHVVVVHDHKRSKLVTTDATVGQVLSDLNINLRKHDRLSPRMKAPVADGMRIVVKRVGIKRVTKTESIPYSVIHRSDSSMYQGNSSVVTSGVEGAKRLVYSVVYVDGKWSGRTLLSSAVLREPRSEIERVGTKQRPVVHTDTAAPVHVRQPQLGRRRGVRVGWRLVDQHRQRLLRRPAVHDQHLGRLRRPGLCAASRPRLARCADRGRRAGASEPGCGRVARVRR